MLFSKKQKEETNVAEIDSSEIEANIESLLEMVIDLNERVRKLECVLVDEGLTAKAFPEIDERGREGLLQEAAELVVAENRASVAFLQKSLRISHIRAFHLLQALEEDGVIGPYRGKGERVVNQTK